MFLQFVEKEAERAVVMVKKICRRSNLFACGFAAAYRSLRRIVVSATAI